jgi:hypothetical protein
LDLEQRPALLEKCLVELMVVHREASARDEVEETAVLSVAY